MCCFCENNVVVFSSIIWYKASLASAQGAQQLKESCQENREGGKSSLFFFFFFFLRSLLQIEQQMLREVFVKNQKVCARSSSIRYIPPDICTASTVTVTHTHTHTLSSLPSQCFLATASNSLHLSLVHSGGQTASLKWSVPCLTARYMERRKTHCCPSQQHLSQIPHWSVWLSL